MTYTKTAMAITTTKASIHPSINRVALEGEYDSDSKGR
jgi:hypothetical protein